MSHTKDLIDESLLKVSEYLNKDYAKVKKRKFYFLLKDTILALKIKVNEHSGFIADSLINKINHSFKFFLSPFFFDSLNSDLSQFNFYRFVIDNCKLFDEFYEMLVDDESKKEYDLLIKFRILSIFLGNEISYHLLHPRVTKEQYELYYKSIKYKITKSGIIVKSSDFAIFGIHPSLIVDTFFIEQYKLPTLVEPILGDIIIDLGAYKGDTVLWFAKNVGDKGTVYGFEPMNSNFRILKKNIEKNNIGNVVLCNSALGEEEGEVFMDGRDGGAFLSLNGKNKVKITTLDKFILDKKIDNVNFIKMDIEGAELSALKGSNDTIKRFKPRLAICVYHKFDDLISIPKYIKSLNDNYRFYLRTNRPDCGEVVLYAINN